MAEKNEDKVYVNQDESLTDLQTLIKYSFLLNFLHESLMNLIIIYICHLVKVIYALGTIGTGQQILPWIHISDAVGIFVHALENENVSGVLNLTSPQPVTNEEFTKQFASALWRPAFIPMPAAVVNLIFGSERGTMLLEGQKVIPKRTLESGYSFLFPDINSCLHDIVK